MNKLNITKERFEKSRYFQRKYGKLEYVSESGKLYKTNKGKILKFKESIKDIAPGIQDWGTTVYIEDLGAELDWKEVFGFVKADCRLYPLLEEDIGVKPYEEPSDRQIRNWIKTKPENFIDYLKEFGYYDYANGTDRDDLEYESTKKFGRKFKESIDADPALVCPYCGGDNCEVSIGTDDLNFTNLDRLQGETFNVECWCNDCDKPYNVTLELNVKEVYPNEDFSDEYI